jgi:hypothetical protein
VIKRRRTMGQGAFTPIRNMGLLNLNHLTKSTSIYNTYLYRVGAGTAQSIYCLAMDWTTGRSRFDPQQRRKDFSCCLCVQTGSGAHLVSCIMGTGGPFPGLNRARGMKLTTHPRLVLRTRTSRSYASFPPKRLRGV